MRHSFHETHINFAAGLEIYKLDGIDDTPNEISLSDESIHASLSEFADRHFILHAPSESNNHGVM